MTDAVPAPTAPGRTTSDAFSTTDWAGHMQALRVARVPCLERALPNGPAQIVDAPRRLADDSV